MNSRRFSIIFPMLVLSLWAASARAGPILLGAANSYAVLGQAGVTNTGQSLIFGNVGGSTATPSVTGFPPGAVVPPAQVLTGSSTAFSDAAAGYNSAQGTAGAVNLTGLTLGVGSANNLVGGVYAFNSSVSLNGILMLDAGGINTASWIFQIGSTLTTASASSVQIFNAGSTGPFSGSITWAVGSAATLGTTTAFQGTIISQAASVLTTGATIGCGRVISLAAAVTLDNNVISMGNCAALAGIGGTVGTGGNGGGGSGGTGGAVVPEPRTIALLACGLVALVLRRSFGRALPSSQPTA